MDANPNRMPAIPLTMRPEIIEPEPGDIFPISRPRMELGKKGGRISFPNLAAALRATIGTIKGDPGPPGTPGAMGQPGQQGVAGPPGVANCRTKRVPASAGLIGLGLSQVIEVTWPTPFADALYTPHADISPATGNTAGLTVMVLPGWTAAKARYAVTNTGITLSPAFTLLASAIHD